MNAAELSERWRHGSGGDLLGLIPHLPGPPLTGPGADKGGAGRGGSA